MRAPQKTTGRYADWLLSPWAILAGMTAGVLIGIFKKELAYAIAPGGQVFLALLQMCVLPIMIAAVSSSLANLLKSKGTRRYVGRMLSVFLGGLLLAALIGTLLGVLGKPGKNIEPASKDILGKVLSDSESDVSLQPSLEFEPESFLSIDDPIKKASSSMQLQKFVLGLVPTNIFFSLSQGENLKILLFSIIFGIGLASISSQRSATVIHGISMLFKVFETIIGWIMYLLPLGLCCLLAEQIARVGVTMMIAMAQFVGMIYLGSGVFILLNGVLIGVATKTSLVRVFAALRRPLMIAFGTRSSFAAMPAALDAMSEGLHVDEGATNLVIPLGITLCRFATVMTFALSTVFFAQLYNRPFTLSEYGVLLVTSILAAVASAGAPGVVALSMLSMIFTPLGLPLDAAITLMLAIDPVTDPILTLVNVHTNCASTALIASRINA